MLPTVNDSSRSDAPAAAPPERFLHGYRPETEAHCWVPLGGLDDLSHHAGGLMAVAHPDTIWDVTTSTIPQEQP